MPTQGLDAVRDLHLPLHQYQIYAKNFMKTHPYCGLFLTMGAGKTLTTLAALYEMNLPGNVLVIAPKNIARSTWLDEIEAWHIPIRTRSFLVDEKGKALGKTRRLKAYEQAAKDTAQGKYAMYFINRELVCDLVKNCKWVFPIVVIDEAQSFKTYNTARFKALKSVRPKIRRLIELTGTPAPNGPMDLWAEIYLLDQGQRLGRNITAYRNTFFNSELIVNGHPVKWTPKPGAEDEIYRRIGDLVISLKNTKLKLPALTMNTIRVHMSPEEMKMYDDMKRNFVLTVKDGDDKLDVTAANAAVLSAKLSQMASGSLYIDDSHRFKVIHKAKLEQCAYMLRNIDSPVIIAYHFQADREMLMTYLTSLGFDPVTFDGSPEMIHAWNRGEIPILLLQPASAGHGLNLQKGGHTLIWYTIPWSLEEYQQCNARLYRQGQTEPVTIHHLLTAKTIDEHILKAINKKDMTQQALIDAVRMSI